MAKQKTDILPYKMATLSLGTAEQFISLTYWSKSKNKYVREKIRAAVRGIRTTREQRIAILKQALPDINRELKQRNREGIYHEDVVGVGKAIGVRTYLSYVDSIIAINKLPDSTIRTIKSYRTSFEAFQASRDEVFGPVAVDLDLIREYVDFMKTATNAADKPYTNKTINDYLWAAQIVSEQLARKSIIPAVVNTSELHLMKIKNQSDMYRPLTSVEKNIIFKHFRKHHPYFYLYLLSLYYTCIRPGELTRLTISNFDVEGGKIRVPWYKAKYKGLTQYVQILSPLQQAYRFFDIYQHSGSNYLFSKGFAPSATPYKGKNISDIWRRECDKIGIAKDAYMYGFKHTFNVDYVENNKGNVDWEWLRMHNRHATIEQTQQYIYKLTPYLLDETRSKILDYFKK